MSQEHEVLIIGLLGEQETKEGAGEHRAVGTDTDTAVSGCFPTESLAR